jgi:hypothetical protein
MRRTEPFHWSGRAMANLAPASSSPSSRGGRTRGAAENLAEGDLVSRRGEGCEGAAGDCDARSWSASVARARKRVRRIGSDFWTGLRGLTGKEPMWLWLELWSAAARRRFCGSCLGMSGLSFGGRPPRRSHESGAEAPQSKTEAETRRDGTFQLGGAEQAQALQGGRDQRLGV